MWSMPTLQPRAKSIESKLLCMGTEQRLGSLLDGWKVVWCQPDHKRLLWHIMVFRPVTKLNGCCGPEKINA